MANLSPKGSRPAQTDETSSAKPVQVFRFGAVSVAIFSEEIETPNGKKTVPNVSLRRGYRDATGSWHHTHGLRKADLLPAAHALVECYDFLAKEDADAPDAE